MALVAISVPFETLEPGMVLAEPVLNRLGQILLSKGSVLSPRHLTVLKTWGISAAVIEGGRSRGPGPLSGRSNPKTCPGQNKNAPVLASSKSVRERNNSSGRSAGCSTFFAGKFLGTRQGGFDI